VRRKHARRGTVATRARASYLWPRVHDARADWLRFGDQGLVRRVCLKRGLQRLRREGLSLRDDVTVRFIGDARLRAGDGWRVRPVLRLQWASGFLQWRLFEVLSEAAFARGVATRTQTVEDMS
jgi:hypothetical protein